MFRLDSHLSVSRAPRPCDLLNSERDGGGRVRGRGALHTITAGSGRKIVIQLTGDAAWNNRRREKTSVSAVGSRRELFVHRDGRSRQHPPEMTTSNQPAALHCVCGLWHSNRYTTPIRWLCGLKRVEPMTLLTLWLRVKTYLLRDNLLNNGVFCETCSLVVK